MASKKTTRNVFANLVLLLSFLFIIGVSIGAKVGEPAKIACNRAYGVESGDICVAIQQSFSLTTSEFRFLNPNLNCNGLFVGQWICVNGHLTN